MKKHIITISGSIGSGKSSTADAVAKYLNYKRFSSGDFMRNIALDRGISLMELSMQAEKDNSIDKEIDEQVKNKSEGENLVIDSRLGFYFIPDSFKVYLNLSPEIAKERIFNNLKENELRKESEDSTTKEEIYQKIIRRRESENLRYKAMHNVDFEDKNNYDIVIQTDENNLESVVKTIEEEYKNWLEK